MSILNNLFGGTKGPSMRRLKPLVDVINQLEPDIQPLSGEALREKTSGFRSRLINGLATLDDLLPEAFAVVREASRRTIGLRHFDVQLMGGIVLHRGKIAEMKTGEGKTLVATLPVYLNALEEQGVHLVTVNDYLARRDVQWMGPIYHSLGLSVAALGHEISSVYDPDVQTGNPSTDGLRKVSRKEAYQADITYGTNHEFGFDYLRDNMAISLSDTVQRGLHYGIVDEVDYILIDEARTPLIISGPAQESTQTYATMARLVPRLQLSEDFTLDEKHRTVSLTDDGINKMEHWLNVGNLFDTENFILTHHIENALRALVLFRKDHEYVVRDRQVIIVDEFTGRMMPGRRYSDGLHQAIEAKEGLKVQQESITYAAVTLQNYFRMYQKLSGMTGTAATEAEEFQAIYGLEPVVIPTHRPLSREDHADFVYKSEAAKWRAAVEEIHERHTASQPILVGTTSIESSERLSELLKRRGIPCQILNAKQHDREAAVVAQAGRLGAVTVATNMAGRGTDIILGGNLEILLAEELRRRGHSITEAPLELIEGLRQEVAARWQEEHDQVIAAGGLHVLGTEKHEARRIDNQLRGRSGRQGDPGSSRFYVGLDDDLLRRFAGERIKGLMEFAGMGEDQPFESKMVSRVLGSAQSKVEGQNFEIRKHLVEYDDVINLHREIIYGDRRRILEGVDLKSQILSIIEGELRYYVSTYLSARDPENWDLDGFSREVGGLVRLPEDFADQSLEDMRREEIETDLLARAQQLYERCEEAVGPLEMRALERLIMLRAIDSHWVLHLTSMENLRQGVGLYAYGQRDPLVTYRTQGHQKFQEMQSAIQRDVAVGICRMSGVNGSTVSSTTPRRHNSIINGSGPITIRTQEAGSRKVGRNDTCPCGSGKKYKRCHGAST
jgi:preprotein translocase subunit SecA